MTSSIGPANRLALAIASQLSRVGAGARALPSRPGTETGVTGSGGKRDLDTLIALRIREIGRDDPRRGRKAFRVFLEAVLLSQCGEHLINDPSFHQLVDDVQGALEGDPGTRRMVDAAVDELLKNPPKRT
jgi:hypothetical protein